MTNTNHMTIRLSYRAGQLVAALGLALLVALSAVGSARADLAFDRVSVSLDEPPRLDPNGPPGAPLVNPDGTFVDRIFSREAGGHPDLTVDFKVATGSDGLPVEAPRNVELDLPLGLVGNPNGIDTCSPQGVSNPGQGGANCPVASQVGTAEITAWSSTGQRVKVVVGIFNIAHGSDVPARFGFKYSSVVGLISARVRPEDYGISSGSFSISQGELVESVRLTLWGVPGDPSHDSMRQDHILALQVGDAFNTPQPPPYYRQLQAPPRPFLTAPPVCSDEPLSFTMRGDSWEHPGAYDTETVTADEDGTPFVIEGCERVPFDPSIDVRPMSRAADAPTGLNVDLRVPQPQDPDGYGSAHVRKVKMVFPEGMSVSPSSAAGLGACSPAEIGLGTNDAPSCPQSSKLGTVSIDTPLLEDPLDGDIILAKQNDNPFGSLIALYIAVKGPGFYVKLPGKVDLDLNTGQLVATFDNTPQLPFSRMLVDFPGGSQAALATPTTCGSYSTHTEITSWASPDPVSIDSPMTVDQNCALKPFAPSFTAGTINPLAGKYSPFAFSLTRSDSMPVLSSIDTTLPNGLMARIASASQCAGAQATTGDCPASSRIGSTSVLSGPGAQPLPLKGDVYLTGPYKGAPFGLSIVTPTAGQAGPFDLGDVVVRAALHVDPSDAHVTVKSDPLPTIIEGIPLRLRQVIVNVDKPTFTINPTSCKAKQIVGQFSALTGEQSQQTEHFRVGGCSDLSFKPRLGLSLTGKSQKTTGKHPGIKAILRQTGVGESGIKNAVVRLPKSLALDPDNAQALCEFEDGTKPDLEKHCPKGSIVGRVKATTPLLAKPLAGSVYFVKNVRIDKRTGNRIRTLPMLVAALRGEIAINLKGTSSVSNGRLVNTFATVPDAPINQFNLNLAGGSRGIIAVTRTTKGKINICNAKQIANVGFDGQNGKNADFRTAMKTPCGKAAKKATSPARRR